MGGFETRPYEGCKNSARKRTLRMGSQITDEFFRGFFAGANAVGDADAMIGATGKSEGGKFIERAFHSSNARVVADVILRHGIGMVADAREKRPGGDAEQARQFVADICSHRRVIEIEKLGLQCAADKSA